MLYNSCVDTDLKSAESNLPKIRRTLVETGPIWHLSGETKPNFVECSAKAGRKSPDVVVREVVEIPGAAGITRRR